MRCITAIFLILFFCSYKLPSYEAKIIGHLKSQSHKNNISNVTIIIQQISFFDYETETDKEGNFDLYYSTEFGKRKFYYINSKKDTVLITKTKLLRVIKDSEDSDMAEEMTFYIP